MKRLICGLLSAIFACVLLAGCGEETVEAERSKLIGTFTNAETVRTNALASAEGNELRLRGDKEAADENGDLYCTVYPFDTIDAPRVSYAFEQRLRLKRDYTYSYQYTITLTNSEDWGNDFARISVTAEGVFNYTAGPDGSYTVLLLSPTEGNFTVYGATASRPGDIYGWTINSSPNYIEDVQAELASDPDYAYNRYLCGRAVKVWRENKTMEDDIFFRDVMDDVAPYCDYTFEGGQA